MTSAAGLSILTMALVWKARSPHLTDRDRCYASETTLELPVHSWFYSSSPFSAHLNFTAIYTIVAMSYLCYIWFLVPTVEAPIHIVLIRPRSWERGHTELLNCVTRSLLGRSGVFYKSWYIILNLSFLAILVILVCTLIWYTKQSEHIQIRKMW